MTAKTAIIIGGGIAGCSTAFALAKRGIAVTLLEQHSELAAEASGNPLAALYPKLSIKPTIQSALALKGFAFTLQLLKQLPDSAGFFNACGQIQLAYDAREQTRQDALIKGIGQDFFQALNKTQASEAAGIALKKDGLFLPHAGWVKPKEWCQALVNLPGITVITQAKVSGIEKNQSCWQVNWGDYPESSENKKTLQAHDLKADIVVLCNANQVNQLYFSSIEMNKQTSSMPVRGQVNFFAPTSVSQAIKTIICSTHYLSPAVDGLHSIGSTYSDELNPHLNPADTLENLTALKHISPEIFNSIQPYKAMGHVAWRSHTQDYLPLAGQLMDEKILRFKPPRYNAHPAELPWLDGLYVNAGHGSKGMITAPICGELIANMACNEALYVESAIASKLNPSRFLLRELGLKQLANTLYSF